MPFRATAIVFTAPDTVEIQDVVLPDMGPDDIRVKTLYSLVSSGTELRVLSGVGESKGKFPLIPGYAIVGEVVEVGAKVKGYRVGDLVSGRNPDVTATGITSLWGGQCSHHIYGTSGYVCPILLPEGAQPLDYIVTEVAAISWRGVHAAGARRGETAVVIGQGLIGALSGAWLVDQGCRVIVVDRAASRLERAKSWGVAGVVNDTEGNTRERIAALCPEGPDIVVEASASVPGLMLAYSLTRPVDQISGTLPQWTRLLLQATYVDKVESHPTDFFPGMGVVILTPGDRRPEDRQHSVEALRSGRLRAADFTDRIVPLKESAATYKLLRDNKNEIFSAIYDWS